MVQNLSVENNFIGGFKTEFTGLNFPENACTAASNCVFTIIGDVLSREGIDFEANFVYTGINRSGQAISTYKWNNVGGDGETQIVVVQVGSILYFFQSTNATLTQPLSTTKLLTTINVSAFVVSSSTFDPTIECQYADGNGYLFVYHPTCEPFYCTFTNGNIVGNVITLKIRDFVGVIDGLTNTTRPGFLTSEHQYNLQNQGWTQGNTWYANSNTLYSGVLGLTIWVVQAGLSGVVNGQTVNVVSQTLGYVATGTVVGYSGSVLQVNITSCAFGLGTFNLTDWTIYPLNTGLINTWVSAIGNYPSDSDVWWTFKNTSDVFAPATTIGNVTLGSGPAPKGFYILSAFNQNRSVTSTISGLTSVSTSVRPRTGTWFQGRVWYAGVDASQPAIGDVNFYTWTENIYFSTIVQTTSDFGTCYQTNDPTDETFFDLLTSDGGVITIQGSGSIYKLFPVQNGLLVFAANGIWFITGRQGIGFVADDYTVTKISGIQSISGTSFVNLLGYPIFWNEEGIYTVSPGQTGALTVENLCLGTILTYYQNIPLQSKKYARGDYDPINFQIQWCYRSTNESTVTDRYQFDTFLILNTANKAFYNYNLLTNGFNLYVHDIRYVVGPGGSTSPDPTLKYLTSAVSGGSYNFTFSEERDSTNFVDWFSFDGIGLAYTSTFTTGFKLHGSAIRKWQPIYINLLATANSGYSIQGVWDYAVLTNSGRFSTKQTIRNTTNQFGSKFRRHKVRGHGYSLQFTVTSLPKVPFTVEGWSVLENINQSA